MQGCCQGMRGCVRVMLGYAEVIHTIPESVVHTRKPSAPLCTMFFTPISIGTIPYNVFHTRKHPYHFVQCFSHS
jgi:hypothetical protein